MTARELIDRALTDEGATTAERLTNVSVYDTRTSVAVRTDADAQVLLSLKPEIQHEPERGWRSLRSPVLARLSPEQARHVAGLLTAAADSAEAGGGGAGDV